MLLHVESKPGAVEGDFNLTHVRVVIAAVRGTMEVLLLRTVLLLSLLAWTTAKTGDQLDGMPALDFFGSD